MKRSRIIGAICAAALFVAAPSDAQIAPEGFDAAYRLALGQFHGGQYAQVEPFARMLHEAQVAALGPFHRATLRTETILARVARELRRNEEALERFSALYDKWRANYPHDDFEVQTSVMNLALGLSRVGKAQQGLPYAARALRYAETELGFADETTIHWRDSLTVLLDSLGAHEEVLSLHRANIEALAAASFGGARYMHVGIMRQVGRTLVKMRRSKEAAEAYRAAVARYDVVHGREHRQTVLARVEYADVLMKLDEFDALERLIDEAYPALVKAYGEESRPMADLLETYALALAHRSPGTDDFSRAVEMMGRSVDLRARLVDAKDRRLADARRYFSSMLFDAEDYPGALREVRLASEGNMFARSAHLRALHANAHFEHITRREAMDEALRIQQSTAQSVAGGAMRMQAARLLLGGELASVHRELSDLINREEVLREELVQLLALPVEERSAEREAALRQESAELDRRILADIARIEAERPDFEAAMGGGVASLDDIQSMLAEDEAAVLVAISPFDHESNFLFTITRDDFAFDWIMPPLAEIEEKVNAVRASISHRLGVRGATSMSERAGRGPEDFDFEAAHWLWDKVLRRSERLVAGKRHVYMDVRGALASVPPQLLLKSHEPGRGFAEADWMIRHHAVTVVPSFFSLKAQRFGAERPRAPQPFLGYGDAVFDPGALQEQMVLAGLSDEVSATRAGLAPLPETAIEVRRVAASLGAGDTEIRLGHAASEAAVKAARLADYRVLHFATHGLVAGEWTSNGAADEPALVLTGGNGEDGLLTASEIMQLRLNADWVLLSACNTAVGGKPGAEALEGLAQSFLYAGARALLVSHWPVESQSAVHLMSSVFEARAGNAQLTGTQAHREAVLAMIDNPPDPAWRHPAFWAPFVLVGNPD